MSGDVEVEIAVKDLRPTVAVIDLDAIRFNVKQVKRKVAPAEVMAVVKSNGYGHGDYEVATAALDAGAASLGVALVEEGIILRKKGIKAPILVFGGFFPEEIPLYVEYNLHFTLYTERNLQALQKITEEKNTSVKVHIKVDTGMGRVGVSITHALDFVRNASRNPRIEIVGIYTHFATSDEKDKSFANLQLQRFMELNNRIENEGIHIPYKHAANSGAILDLPNSYLDLVRPGIMLYGYYPSTETSESILIKPAMTLKSKVIMMNNMDKGVRVGYGMEYITRQETIIAIIPIGYADGYNRILSNRAKVKIRDRVYPVVGKICMDQILIDVGLSSNINIGDDVILLAPNEGEEVHMNNFCKILQTIPYEVSCRISERVPRIYIN